MKVDQVTDQQGAADYFGDDDLYEAHEHAVAKPEDASLADFDRVILANIVRILRVRRQQAWTNLIYRGDGTLEPAQFQGREIHPESARLLDELIGISQ
jgi:hypothetical protein